MKDKWLKKYIFLVNISFAFLLLIRPLHFGLAIDSHSWPTQDMPINLSNSVDNTFSESFTLNSENSKRTYLITESVDYLGVFKVGVTHAEPRAMKHRGFELNWTNTPDILLLVNRSELNLDTTWTYYFANLSATQSDPLEFSVFLKENITELSLKWMFIFNVHLTRKLSPQAPSFGTGSALTTVNTTYKTFLGIYPESTSNVTFQIKGGYEDENKTYLVSPGTWLIHNVTVRPREEGGIDSFPHTDINIKLENLSGAAKITVFHTPIAWNPDVDQNLDIAGIGIEAPLAIMVVLGAFLLLFTLTKGRRKKYYEK
jgi:hypothetical protein